VEAAMSGQPLIHVNDGSIAEAFDCHTCRVT
jgi:hypothetical protein